MKHKTTSLHADDGAALHAELWIPDGDLQAILIIVHGMTEHIGRYEKLSERLTDAGIVTAGFDLRGHGQNRPEGSVAFMEEDGWENSIKDLHRFHGDLIRRFPNLPIHVLGFSLGSFLVRDALSRYPDDFHSAILSGTGDNPGWMLSLLIKKIQKEGAKTGFQNTTPLVEKLTFETYNKQFKNPSSRFEWLLKDPLSRSVYETDPLCKKSISTGLFFDLLSSMKRTGEPAVLSHWNPNLPVLLLSGAEDPVGAQGKGVRSFAAKLKKSGHKNVECVLLPNARHDLFHEFESNAAEEAAGILRIFLLKQLL